MGVELKKDMFKVIKPTDQKILNELELSIKLGKWVLVEKMGETLHPDLEPIINPLWKIKGKCKMIKIGDKEVEFNEDFKIFLTTTLPNPVYAPEILVKVTLINFEITHNGLIDQMLSLVVLIEKFEIESERNQLIETNNTNTKRLIVTEDEILEELENSDPDKILDDDELINKLSTTKEDSKRIKSDQAAARERGIEIKLERDK